MLTQKKKTFKEKLVMIELWIDRKLGLPGAYERLNSPSVFIVVSRTSGHLY